MNWRPHTEPPSSLPAVALIALHDPTDGTYFLLGLAMQTVHRPGVWVDEDSGAPIDDRIFWWLPEAELIAPFTVQVAA